MCLLFTKSGFLTVVNLTLIDLPGLTKVAVGRFFFIGFSYENKKVLFCSFFFHKKVLFYLTLINYLDCLEGQPDSIVAEIENMVRSYIEKVVSFPTSHLFTYKDIDT